jgi:hypothetical protein
MNVDRVIQEVGAKVREVVREREGEIADLKAALLSTMSELAAARRAISSIARERDYARAHLAEALMGKHQAEAKVLEQSEEHDGFVLKMQEDHEAELREVKRRARRRVRKIEQQYRQDTENFCRNREDMLARQGVDMRGVEVTCPDCGYQFPA